jgi:hypothetical protein
VLDCYRYKRKQQPAFITRGKKEICTKSEAGKREYKARTEELERRQDFKCAICQRVFLVMTFDHEAGRGAGKRDDRVLDEKGKWMNAALCMSCNGFKGSRRYRWIEGQYVPVTKFKEVA